MINIKIVSNIINNDLYLMSKSFYEELDYEKLFIYGHNDLYNYNFIKYIIKNSELYNLEWVIYIDEDCFIFDTNAMKELLYYQIENDIYFSGMPDGGVISHRFHNPLAINPFFMIFNVKKIKEIFNENEIDISFYNSDLDVHIPHNLIKKDIIYNEKFERIIAEGYEPYGIRYDNFEPCYKFFFWLLRKNIKIFYLNAYDSILDDFTTVLKNHKQIDFAYHTWFARNWNDINNQKRIIEVFNYCKNNNKI